MSTTFGNTAALNQLLLESYGGKVGLALELPRVRNLLRRLKSLFTLPLTNLRKDGNDSEVSLQS